MISKNVKSKVIKFKNEIKTSFKEWIKNIFEYINFKSKQKFLLNQTSYIFLLQ